jgi:putative tryptophan/tyrosine transport system ATP-binding protein
MQSAPAAATPVLALDGLRKSFHQGTADRRTALDGVSLSLRHGDFAVVIGGNGAGKSTLLNAIAGETELDSGAIAIEGTDVAAMPTHKRAKWLARVFQDPLAGTAGTLTVAENLSVAQRRAKPSGLRWGLTAESRRRYRDRLAGLGLGLEDRLDQKVAQLSGGQRQSLALAMAVLTAPTLLLLDEHCAALDPKTAEVVMQETVKAVAGEKLTALMVTHNMQHAIQYGNRLVMMMSGRIVYEAEGAEKAALTIEHLVRRFHITSDRMVLS